MTEDWIGNLNKKREWNWGHAGTKLMYEGYTYGNKFLRIYTLYQLFPKIELYI